MVDTPRPVPVVVMLPEVIVLKGPDVVIAGRSLLGPAVRRVGVNPAPVVEAARELAPSVREIEVVGPGAPERRPDDVEESRSPAHATLFWEGDELVNWDRYDGIEWAVTGLLSGGLSGMVYNHSDIGGYTAVSSPESGAVGRQFVENLEGLGVRAG